MRTLFDAVAPPDLVVLLDVEPAVAWGRRSQYMLDEVGRWDGFGGDAFDSFCAYQQLVRGELLETRRRVRVGRHPPDRGHVRRGGGRRDQRPGLALARAAEPRRRR